MRLVEKGSVGLCSVLLLGFGGNLIWSGGNDPGLFHVFENRNSLVKDFDSKTFAGTAI